MSQTDIRSLRDTFVDFLDDQLTGLVVVHVITRDPNKVASSSLRMDALNVKFLGVGISPLLPSQEVVLDIIHSNELSALALVEIVGDLLSRTYFTPRYDYTNPSAPLAIPQSNVYWSKVLPFRSIYNDLYSQFSCSLVLKEQAS